MFIRTDGRFGRSIGSSFPGSMERPLVSSREGHSEITAVLHRTRSFSERIDNCATIK